MNTKILSTSISTFRAVLFFVLCAVSVPVATAQQYSEAEFAEAHHVGELVQAGKFREALPFVERGLERNRQRFGNNHPETLTFMRSLAMIHMGLGDNKAAAQLLEQAVAIGDKVLGPNDPDSISGVRALGKCYADLGSWNKALPAFTRVMTALEKRVGRSDTETIAAVSNVATSSYECGKYVEALGYFQRVLKSDEATAGADSLQVAQDLQNISQCQMKLENYSEAEKALDRSYPIFVKRLGGDHKTTQSVARGLSVLRKLRSSSRPCKRNAAQDCEGSTVDVSVQCSDEEAREKALEMNLTAAEALRAGDLAKAEPLFEQVLALVEKTQGKQHRDTAAVMHNLAALKAALGRNEEAERLYLRALAVKEETQGKSHPDVADTLINLANLYIEQGQEKRAGPLLERALPICVETYGEAHSRTATVLNSLASIADREDDFPRAEILYKRTLKSLEQKLDASDTTLAPVLNNLGGMELRRGNKAIAIPLLQRAVSISTKAKGATHVDTTAMQSNLALAQFEAGMNDEAVATIKLADEGYRTAFENVLSFASESERLSWQSQKTPYTLWALAGDARGFATAVLRYKGAVLDSIIEDRAVAATTGADRRVLDEWRKARSEAWQAAVSMGGKANGDNFEKLSAKVRDLEKTLARSFVALGKSRQAPGVKLEDVQAALPPGTVTVEFLKYPHLIGGMKLEFRYAALVITHDATPCIVALGPAGELENLIKKYQEAARTGAPDGATLPEVNRSLHERLWQPIARSLPQNTQEVVLCPDGQTNFVSFASLAGQDGQFVCEQYRVRYVSASRDLLKQPKKRESGHAQDIVLVGNPDYRDSTPLRLMAQSADIERAASAQNLVATNLRGGLSNDVRGINFSPLPGTAIEVAGLKARFEANGWKARTLTGDLATESALQSVQSPTILHLATHGFFLDELQVGKKNEIYAGLANETFSQPSGPVRDPMLRSGLALSGAQSTMNLWANGKVPPLDRDGILTAAEAASLNLNGTFLVTLSACETGLGEARSGEGVMGLKRGFAVAGAENLLMTLWQISDADTVALMGAFYDRVLKGEHPARALPAVQTEFLVRLRKEHGLFHAINRAGPFVLVGGTALPSKDIK